MIVSIVEPTYSGHGHHKKIHTVPVGQVSTISKVWGVTTIFKLHGTKKCKSCKNQQNIMRNQIKQLDYSYQMNDTGRCQPNRDEDGDELSQSVTVR